MTKLEEKLKKVVSYSPQYCPNCNRRRVELFEFESGLKLHICEKCNWCIEYDTYVSEQEKDEWCYD